MKNYKHPKSPGTGETIPESLPPQLPPKSAEPIIAVLIGLYTDTPVPISLLSGYCSHTTIREKYVPLGLRLHTVDQKTCVRLSEFVKVREVRAKSGEAAGN